MFHVIMNNRVYPKWSKISRRQIVLKLFFFCICQSFEVQFISPQLIFKSSMISEYPEIISNFSLSPILLSNQYQSPANPAP